MQTRILRDATGLNQTLRSRRKELGLTQEELGQRAGVAAKHVSRIENGTHEPKVSTLFALVSALGLELALGETGKVASAPSVRDIF
jgi:transcriptional regulator with XRE-family HTH domain